MYPTTKKEPPINLIFHKMYCIKMSKKKIQTQFYLTMDKMFKKILEIPR